MAAVSAMSEKENMHNELLNVFNNILMYYNKILMYYLLNTEYYILHNIFQTLGIGMFFSSLQCHEKIKKWMKKGR